MNEKAAPSAAQGPAAQPPCLNGRPSRASSLREGIDYTLDPHGRYIFTADYLRRRGSCCGNLCKNCPYGWENVPASALARGARVSVR